MHCPFLRTVGGLFLQCLTFSKGPAVSGVSGSTDVEVQAFVGEVDDDVLDICESVDFVQHGVGHCLQIVELQVVELPRGALGVELAQVGLFAHGDKNALDCLLRFLVM